MNLGDIVRHKLDPYGLPTWMGMPNLGTKMHVYPLPVVGTQYDAHLNKVVFLLNGSWQSLFYTPDEIDYLDRNWFDADLFEPVPDPFTTVTVPDVDFPHTCPRCAGPAWIGFTSVDCKRGC